MTAATDVGNPNRLARVVGLLFVVLAVLGPFSMLYVPGRIVAAGDAVATAANVRESGGLLRGALVTDVAIMLIEVAVPVLLYLLFRPVSRGVALTAAFARLGEAFVIGAGLVAYPLALRLADGGGPGGLAAGQREAVALLALEAHGDVVLIGQVFFGFSLALLGWLVLRAGYVPRFFGVLLWIAAAGYLADSLGTLLWNGYGDSLGWLVGVTAVVGEVPFFLWLLVRGVDRSAWTARASRSGTGSWEGTKALTGSTPRPRG